MKFLASKANFDFSNIVLIGIPFDATSSFKSGSRFAPDAIRIASDVLETYSPYFDYDIENIDFYDYGNFFTTINNFNLLKNKLTNLVTEFLNKGKKILSIGGEHLITLPVVEAYYKKYSDLILLHVDAHADLRDEYLNEKYSHATVIKRIADFIPTNRIYQFGIRSGLKEEFIFAKQNINFYPFTINISENILTLLKDKKIYLTIDLDVLDPSIFPGTGTPEPGGITFNDLINFLRKIYNLNIIGADVVELSPHYDNSGVSSIVAAKTIRELLIVLNKNQRSM